MPEKRAIRGQLAEYGVFMLSEKLRCILWQFPPAFVCALPRLQLFLRNLARYPARNALEFRHESECCEEVSSLCREYHIALCMADWPEFIEELPHTCDFAALRRHGRSGCNSRDERAEDDRRLIDAVRIRI